MHARAETTQNFVRYRRNCRRHLPRIECLQGVVALRAEEYHFVARIDVFEISDVCCQHVHAHGADDTRTAAAKQDVSAIFQTAIESVGVPSRNHSKRRRSIWTEPRTIANALACADLLDRNHATRERQHCFKSQRSTEWWRDDPMQQETGADKVVPHARITQKSRAVCGVTVLGPCAKRVERSPGGIEVHALRLKQLMFGLIGGREVRVHRFELEVRTRQELRQCPLHVLVAEAEAMHAGVDLEVVPKPRVACAG